MVSSAALEAPASAGGPTRERSATERYRRSLWLLTSRDLRVRYSTSALGYLWSVLEPLVLAIIYWFIFVEVFNRHTHPPYMVFLLVGLLPWTWFQGAVSDATKAFTSEAKLIRSTTIPRSIWVARQCLSKGIEFIISLPVLVVFVVVSDFTDTPATLHWQIVFFPLAIVLQAMFSYGLGLIIAPLTVLFRDLERVVRLALRFLFYLSTVLFSLGDLHRLGIEKLAALNPLAGIMCLYRAGLFPHELNLFAILVACVASPLTLVIGLLVFRRLVPSVLKEL